MSVFLYKMQRLLQYNGTKYTNVYVLTSSEVSHIDLMPYLWTIIIDISIFFALYKFKALNIYIHALIALFVSLTTFITAIPTLINRGIPAKENQYHTQRHYIIGLIVIILIFIQVMLGIISKIMQLIHWSHPYPLYSMNVLHKYLGYGLTILCKVQVFLILSLKDIYTKELIGLAVAEGVLVTIWLICKLCRFTLEETVVPAYDNVRTVDGIQQILKDNPRVVVFANYVFSVEPLLHHHPCGYRIIDAVKGMEMDRFMYGMYPAERFPLIPPNSHGFKSLSLLDNPLAKISIPAIYLGLESGKIEVELSSVSLISVNCSIYEVRLHLKNGKFQFQGYTSLKQIGRYYSLTIDNSKTRLYTSVGFLDPKNITFLTKELGMKKSAYSKTINNKTSKDMSESQRNIQEIEETNYLSLLVKLYPTGKLTPKLIAKKFQTLHLSETLGEGLRLHSLTPGKVIIVAGGTGLYPFCDLLDLLFKENLAEINPVHKALILKHNAILEGKPFDHFKFHLMLAVNQIEDIHPITLRQIVELSEHSTKFKLTMRVTKQEELLKVAYKAICFTSELFDSLVLKEMELQEFRKVWICGPPAMTTSIVSAFDKKEISEESYLLV